VMTIPGFEGVRPGASAPGVCALGATHQSDVAAMTAISSR